jgi:Raf kinase inhibitor-like YbhB/YbcL family protein
MQIHSAALRASWITVIAALCLSSPEHAIAQVGKMSFQISTSSFQAGGLIPKKFTCDAADVSPELSWTGAPQGAKSFALIADDPDAPAGTWTHWVIYDLPPSLNNLPENTPKVDELPDGAQQGRNDFKKIGYNGPCPPPGKPHRYYFKLYALDQKLEIKPGASKSELEHAMQGHILAQTEVVGKYQR